MRAKKTIPSMMPIKKWLDISEATAYTNMCRNTFLKYVAPNVTIAMLGPKQVYNVSQIDSYIESNVIVKKVTS